MSDVAPVEPPGPGRLGKPRAPRKRIFGVHGPDPIDVHVGAQMRMARMFSGMTLAQIAAALNVSRQAIDRYERAQMRVSAYKLWQAAHLFKKPIGYFFEGLLQGGNPRRGATRSRIELELVAAFRSVQSRELRM